MVSLSSILKRLWSQGLPPAVFTILVQVLNVSAQLAVDILLARGFGPEIVGELIFAFSIAGLLGIFLLFGTGEIAIQMYARKKETPQAVFTGASMMLVIGATVCLTLTTIILGIMELPTRASVLVYTVVAVLILNGAASVCNHALVAFDASKHDLKVTSSTRTLLVVGIAAAVITESLVMAMSAYIFSATTSAIGRAWLVHRHCFTLRIEYDPSVLGQLWRRGRSIGFGAIFGTISNRADMLVIRSWVGAIDTGLYGAAYRIVTGVQMGATSVSFALFPYLGQQERKPHIERLFIALPVLGAAALILTALTLAEPLMPLIFGEAFAPAGVYLKYLLLAAALQTLAVFLSRWMISREMERYLPRAQAASAVVNIGLLVSLVPTLGGFGAVLATLGCEVVGFVMLATAALLERGHVMKQEVR